jgi:hypothetical protein
MGDAEIQDARITGYRIQDAGCWIFDIRSG